VWNRSSGCFVLLDAPLEVRPERCIVSAVRAGATQAQMADMLFAAATDHRYLDVGHVLDFTNKAFEALDIAGWSHERLP
jgi:hypothetical protein